MGRGLTMTSQSQNVDEEWAKLAEEAESAREERMLERYKALAALSEAERHEKLLAMARAEYLLGNDLLTPFSMSRLRCYLSLPEEDARKVASAYDKVMGVMPAEAAMRRVTIVQSLTMQFSAEDEERLRSLIPNVFAGAPGRGGLDSPIRERTDESTSRSKKPFWAFWKR